MKKFIFVFVVVAVGILAMQEIKTGVIQYELRMDMHRRITEEREELKKMIPQFRTENFDLFFTQTESHYKPNEDEEEEEPMSGGMGFRMNIPRTETFLDLRTRARTVLQEFMGKKYIIEDTLKLIPWKFGTEKLEILGYKCSMAYHTDTTTNSEITAWFTPEIMPFVGPDQYANLPGTVLAVDINNGERTWIARKVKFGGLRKNDVRKPTKGEVISHDQYKKMVEEQMEKMREQGGMRMRFGG